MRWKFNHTGIFPHEEHYNILNSYLQTACVSVIGFSMLFWAIKSYWGLSLPGCWGNKMITMESRNAVNSYLVFDCHFDTFVEFHTWAAQPVFGLIRLNLHSHSSYLQQHYIQRLKVWLNWIWIFSHISLPNQLQPYKKGYWTTNMLKH